MNWKKLQQDFHGFASELGLVVEEDETAYINGKSTAHRMVEPGVAYYELKHNKPIAEYGSKLRVYSEFSGNLFIKVRPKLFRSPIIKSNVKLNSEMKSSLITLCSQIGRFEWGTEPHHKGWPFHLANAQALTFECKNINEAVSALPEIRRIHLKLIQEFGLVT